MKWLRWVFVCAGLLTILFGCYNPNIEPEGKTWAKGAIGGKPAKNKPAFVTRAYYKTEEGFRKALCKKVAWLEDKGYEITLIKPVYGRDMRRREVIMYYMIYYKEKK